MSCLFGSSLQKPREVTGTLTVDGGALVGDVVSGKGTETDAGGGRDRKVEGGRDHVLVMNHLILRQESHQQQVYVGVESHEPDVHERSVGPLSWII